VGRVGFDIGHLLEARPVRAASPLSAKPRTFGYVVIITACKVRRHMSVVRVAGAWRAARQGDCFAASFARP
jgi:hypothetical protein